MLGLAKKELTTLILTLFLGFHILNAQDIIAKDKNSPYVKFASVLFLIEKTFYFDKRNDKQLFLALQKNWLSNSKKTCSLLYRDIGAHSSFLLYYNSCINELLESRSAFLWKNFLCKNAQMSSEECPYKNINSFTPKNLTQYNNIAYYLQQAGANEEAAYLLKKILKKFPKRTVAYINLGDAYWALGKKSKARKAYTTYIEQMCAKGLQKKIPKKVLKRVRNKR